MTETTAAANDRNSFGCHVTNVTAATHVTKERVSEKIAPDNAE
jgi:hypothetical protein